MKDYNKCRELLEEIATSVASIFGALPNPVVGQEHPAKKYVKDTYKKREKKV